MRIDAEPAGKQQGAQVSQANGEGDADGCVAQRRAGVAERVVSGGVEAAEGGSQQADCRAGDDPPNVYGIVVGKLAALVERGGHHVAQGEEGHGRGHDEEGDLAQSGVKTGAQTGGDFSVGAQGARHGGELGGGYGHAEQAHGQGVNGLRVGQRGDRSGAEQTGDQLIHPGADLDYAAADEYGREVAHHVAHVCRRSIEGETQLSGETQHGGQLHQELKRAADYGSPGQVDGQGGEIVAAEGDHGGDHGDIPNHRRGVGEEEFPVAFEDAQRPGGW